MGGGGAERKRGGCRRQGVRGCWLHLFSCQSCQSHLRCGESSLIWCEPVFTSCLAVCMCAYLSMTFLTAAFSHPPEEDIPQLQRRRKRWQAEGKRDDAHLRLMTKALMRIIRRTTLPTTDTSNTVELAPSPIMGAGTLGKRELKGVEGGKEKISIKWEMLGRDKEKSQHHYAWPSCYASKSCCASSVCQSNWSPSYFLPICLPIQAQCLFPLPPFYSPPHIVCRSACFIGRQWQPISMCVWPCRYHVPLGICITKRTPGSSVHHCHFNLMYMQWILQGNGEC